MSNKKINKLILEIAEEIKLTEPKMSWVKVQDILRTKHSIYKSTNAIRCIYDRQKNKKDENDLEIQVSEKLLQINDKELKTPEYILKAHGYDPEKFILIDGLSNLWSKENAQSKIRVKPKDDTFLTRDDIADVLKEIKPLEISLKKEFKYDNNEMFGLEIDFADAHVGAFSWHEETGEDNDYKLTFTRIKRQVEKARLYIEKNNVEKVMLCFLGDFLHVDTNSGTTTKGTVVDYDTRPKKMVSKALELLMYIIDRLAIVETELYWIEGNHSRLVEYTLFQSLPYIYKNQKHIKFDVSPKTRKAFMYGDNLIGIHHGEIKKDNIFNWLQVEYREMWGKAKYAEQHSGHIHQEKVIEKGGIIQRTNPTSKTIDLYEFENGWISEKLTMAYVWSKKNKLEQQIYLR